MGKIYLYILYWKLSFLDVIKYFDIHAAFTFNKQSISKNQR